jgi:dolichyl-diphosphooligosaccharide--protein glycosyltransferase
MWTAAVFFKIMHFFHFTINIRNTCVFLSPFMASNTCIATYLLTKRVWNGGAGILAATFIALSGGYISRSVAGSYDNEAVAIFALVFAFYLWVTALQTGSMLWSCLAALGYFNMVAAWGGYIFIINIIPVHVFVLLLVGRYSRRLYVSYCIWYVLGTLMSMNVQFVGFQPVSISPEHLASMGIFGLLQIYAFVNWLRSMLSAKDIKVLFRFVLFLVVGLIGLIVLLVMTGSVPMLTGRLLSLLGATSNIAIVKSVSEHQPSAWTTFFFDLHCLVFLVPTGMFFIFNNLTDGNIFVLVYAIFASYFSSIMVRLVLVMAPAACIVAAIGVNVVLQTYMDVLTCDSKGRKQESILDYPDTITTSNTSVVSAINGADDEDAPIDSAASAEASDVEVVDAAPQYVQSRVSKIVALLVICGFFLLFFFLTVHSTYVSSSAYSSPSIVLFGTGGRGERIVFDDFREAYTWLRHNTPENARILSWWDYGYQITGMANRTVIVDNNTRNNTHIATVGMALASKEERAYDVFQMYDVDYALVVFGGRIGYSQDDINKFLWMVRIAGGTWPEVVESAFFNSGGRYAIDTTVSPTFKNSLMYKMCYYRFSEMAGGMDRARNAKVGVDNIELEYIEEAFTSEHWMVRIYRVKKEKTHPGFLDKLAAEKKSQ